MALCLKVMYSSTKITDRKEKSEQGSTKNVEADIFNFELCIAAERV